MNAVERIIEELERETEHAFETQQANRKGGSPAESVAHDTGRYMGLKDALEIARGIYEAGKNH